MTSKRANQLFLTMILTHIAASLLLSVFGAYFKIGIIVNFLLAEAILMGPALLFLLVTRAEYVPGAGAAGPMRSGAAAMPQPVRPTAFRRIRISTILMIALATVLLMPFVTVLNALTLFFTDNAVAAMQGDVLSLPFPVMLFIIGILAPFCEEFVFRGIIYGSYADYGGRTRPQTAGIAPKRRNGVWPILLSALAFGLMHMNFNQAVYAFAIGVFLAVLVEAAGSLWASVFCHMFFNSYEVVMMYLAKAIGGSEYMENVSKAAAELTSTQLQAGLAVYLLIAAVTTPISLCCVAWIAKNEGRQEAVRALFSGPNGRADGQGAAQMPSGGLQHQQQREPLVTTPLIVAVVLCLGFMSLDWFLF